MQDARLLKRIDKLIQQAENATQHTIFNRDYEEYEVDADLFVGLKSACMSFIDRIYGKTHPHYLEFTDNVTHSFKSDVNKAIALLNVMKDEIESGWLTDLKELVAAELFADFLDMSEYLLNEGYKDPAAVIIGSVLEEHLRQVCQINEISVEVERGEKTRPKKADSMNNDLVKAEVYSKLDQKAVTSWLDLRNLAAHGKYNEYNTNQVNNMLSGVTEFMSRIASKKTF